MTTTAAKRARVLATLQTLEGGGDSAKLLALIVKRAPASELPRIGRILASMVRGETMMRKAKRRGFVANHDDPPPKGDPVHMVRQVMGEEWYPFRLEALAVPAGKKRAKRFEFVRYGIDGASASDTLSRELVRQGFTVQNITAHTMPAYIPHGPEGKPTRTATVPPLGRSFDPSKPKRNAGEPSTFFYIRKGSGGIFVESEDGDVFGPFDTMAAAKAFRDQKEGKRRNPHLLTIGNPTSPDLAAAIRAYKRFHGVAPAPGAIKFGDGNGALIALGELSRIDYRPRKGDRAGPIWFHHFKAGCVLCTDPEGRRLVVLDRHGKRLVDFDRGIIR